MSLEALIRKLPVTAKFVEYFPHQRLVSKNSVVGHMKEEYGEKSVTAALKSLEGNDSWTNRGWYQVKGEEPQVSIYQQILLEERIQELQKTPMKVKVVFALFCVTAFAVAVSSISLSSLRNRICA